jgi:hypothetical protein
MALKFEHRNVIRYEKKLETKRQICLTYKKSQITIVGIGLLVRGTMVEFGVGFIGVDRSFDDGRATSKSLEISRSIEEPH